MNKKEANFNLKVTQLCFVLTERSLELTEFMCKQLDSVFTLDREQRLETEHCTEFLKRKDKLLHPEMYLLHMKMLL